MTMMSTQGSVNRAPRPSSLADVLDLILDKGLVIDAYVRVSALGIEVLTIDARIVVASVDTYLRFAEAVNRLDLGQTETQGVEGLTESLTEKGAEGKTEGALEGIKRGLGRGGGDDDEKGDEENGSGRRSRRRAASRS